LHRNCKQKRVLAEKEQELWRIVPVRADQISPRLFWPKSRCYDYLYQEAEALLKNFPVQATISFYEDSDSEDDEDELEQESRTQSDC
ncbi:PREDICTED: protein ripply2-like, partial [Mesitornis unicolor]|uniref:protein ripply2-like n=1 Tax=Mesitornis unicolor TaxID=54374 RepID=UPI00052952DA